MRILHIADRLSARGGAYRSLLGTLDALSRDHVQELVVGIDDGSARAPCPVRRAAGLDSRTTAPACWDAITGSFEPDVVHVHNVVNPSVLERAAAAGAVMTVQDHRFFCPGRGKWTADGSVCREAMRREVCAGCFDDADYFEHVRALTDRRLSALRRMRLVVLSEYMKREIAAVGVPAERIAVVPPYPHGIDESRRSPKRGHVLFVGRLVEAKGVREAIEAWTRSGVRLPLVIAGTGPLRSRIHERGCTVLGWVPHERLSALYGEAAALVMPSRWQEPFGIVGLEAMTMGAPVAAWDSGGVGEWHPGEGLVEWGDIDGLARALREAVGRAALPPRGFDRDAHLRGLVDVYRSASVKGS